MCQGFGGPVTYWPQSRDPRHLAAAERNYREFRSKYGQVPGGLFGGDENCRPGQNDPRQAIETCGMVANYDKAQRLLGWTPTVDPDEGLRLEAAWIRSRSA